MQSYNFAPTFLCDPFKRVNENTGKEVAYTDIVKGFKIEDRYIVLEDEDFEAVGAIKSKTIDILTFAL